VTDPRISPDGKEVVYVQTETDKEKKEYASQLFLLNIKEKKPMQWTYGKARNHSPCWSPDGKKIAFVSNRDGKQQIYILPRTGGEAKQVTFCKNGANNPVWSPCGNKLAFSVMIEKNETIDEQRKEEEKKQEKEIEPLIVDKMKYKSDAEGLLDTNTYSHIGILDLKTDKLVQLTEG